ncbi:MAG: DUF3298 and DUF4163 domain-containing protein [Christensenellales bacterium]|jgi:hypothetical protein
MKMKRRIQTAALLMALILLLSLWTGCDLPRTRDRRQSPTATATAITDTVAAMKAGSRSGRDPLRFSYEVYLQTIYDDNDGGVLVDAKMTYPQFENPKNEAGITAINTYYRRQLEDFIHNIRIEAVPNAQENKAEAQKLGFEFRPHAFDRSTSIEYNQNGLVSVLNEQYENTGGAHPMTIWMAETFDVETGKKLTLADLFNTDMETALEKVYASVSEQVAQLQADGSIFFNDSVKQDIRENYSPDDFYIRGGDLVVFYQLYAIAPYAVGIQSFVVPWQ